MSILVKGSNGSLNNKNGYILSTHTTKDIVTGMNTFVMDILLSAGDYLISENDFKLSPGKVANSIDIYRVSLNKPFILKKNNKPFMSTHDIIKESEEIIETINDKIFISACYFKHKIYYLRYVSQYNYEILSYDIETKIYTTIGSFVQSGIYYNENYNIIMTMLNENEILFSISNSTVNNQSTMFIYDIDANTKININIYSSGYYTYAGFPHMFRSNGKTTTYIFKGISSGGYGSRYISIYDFNKDDNLWTQKQFVDFHALTNGGTLHDAIYYGDKLHLIFCDNQNNESLYYHIEDYSDPNNITSTESKCGGESNSSIYTNNIKFIYDDNWNNNPNSLIYQANVGLFQTPQCILRTNIQTNKLSSYNIWDFQPFMISPTEIMYLSRYKIQNNSYYDKLIKVKYKYNIYVDDTIKINGVKMTKEGYYEFEQHLMDNVLVE